MKRRPIQLLVLAAIQWLNPVANILLASYRFHLSPEVVIQTAWMNLDWSGRFAFFLAGPILGVAIVWVKRWSFWMAMATAGFVLLHNAWVCYFQPGPVYWPLAVLVFALQFVLIAYLLIPQVRRPYFDSKIRWWEHQPRYTATVPCLLRSKDQVFSAFVKNVSQGGMFLVLDAPLAQGDPVVIQPSWAGAEPLQAKVVHTVSPTGERGVGVQFIHDRATRRQVKKYVRQLRKAGVPCSREPRKYLSELRAWLPKLIRGKELVPGGEIAPSRDTHRKSI